MNYVIYSCISIGLFFQGCKVEKLLYPMINGCNMTYYHVTIEGFEENIFSDTIINGVKYKSKKSRSDGFADTFSYMRYEKGNYFVLHKGKEYYFHSNTLSVGEKNYYEPDSTYFEVVSLNDTLVTPNKTYTNLVNIQFYHYSNGGDSIKANNYYQYGTGYIGQKWGDVLETYLVKKSKCR